MDIIEAMKMRHAVRSYTDKKIEGDVLEKLQGYIYECNEKSGLNIQLCLDEAKAFDGFLAHYGSSFKNVKNYIALVGKKGKDLEEKCGYWGEKIVLCATQSGLASCCGLAGHLAKENVPVK
jgi:hypothetical protein